MRGGAGVMTGEATALLLLFPSSPECLLPSLAFRTMPSIARAGCAVGGLYSEGLVDGDVDIVDGEKAPSRRW
jgi:hypothetical protein